MHTNGLIQHGWIEVICGCMFSGKSDTAAVEIIKEEISKIRRVLIFTPIEAKRKITITATGEEMDTTDKLASRSGKSFDAIPFPKADPEFILRHIESLAEKPTTVVIEEAHFVSKKLIMVCRILAEKYRIRVIVVGLDQTFDEEGFGPIPELMVEAEIVRKVLAVCVECGSFNASKSWLKPEARAKLQGNIHVGDTDYIALCRHCRRKLQQLIT